MRSLNKYIRRLVLKMSVCFLPFLQPNLCPARAFCLWNKEGSVASNRSVKLPGRKMFVFCGDDAHSVLLLLEMMLCRTFVISKDVVDPASFDNFFVFSVFLLQSIYAVSGISGRRCIENLTTKLKCSHQHVTVYNLCWRCKLWNCTRHTDRKPMMEARFVLHFTAGCI